MCTYQIFRVALKNGNSDNIILLIFYRLNMFLIIFYVFVYIFRYYMYFLDKFGTFSLFKKLNIMDMDNSVVIEGMEGDRWRWWRA